MEKDTKIHSTRWITEATDELIEDIVRSRYEKEEAKKIEEVAKDFIGFCRKIGGKPKIREYISRYHGSLDLACHFEDKKESYLRYQRGLHISTGKGYGTLKLPKGLDKAVLCIEPENVEFVIFNECIKPPEFIARISGIKEISADIFEDHVGVYIRSKTLEELIKCPKINI